jgi:hypothetical protein
VQGFGSPYSFQISDYYLSILLNRNNFNSKYAPPFEIIPIKTVASNLELTPNKSM